MGIEAAVIAGGAGLLGSAMAGRSAERAARTSADAQLEAARIAAPARLLLSIWARYSNFATG